MSWASARTDITFCSIEATSDYYNEHLYNDVGLYTNVLESTRPREVWNAEIAPTLR